MSLVDDLPKAFAAFYDDESAHLPGVRLGPPRSRRNALTLLAADALPRQEMA